MERRVEPEWLDELPAENPRAARSRRDLRRVNRAMGNARLMGAALRRRWTGNSAQTLVELGAGDGTFLLAVARSLGPRWRGIRTTLLDRAAVAAPETLTAFGNVGWSATTLQSDIFEFLRLPAANSDVMIANLFLHHFSEDRLTELLRLASKRAKLFVALEPRRSAFSLLFSRLVILLGCNDVTRHDAVISVRAGFAGYELSSLWPQKAWTIEERPAGPFSHLFVARRLNG